MKPSDPASPGPSRSRSVQHAESISGEADGDEFVGFSLGGLGFIMRRVPFFAAVHRGPVAERSSGDSPKAVAACYINGFLRFNDRDIPLFRLDDLLRDVFRIPGPAGLRAGLVARIDSFEPAAAETFRAAALARLPGADTEFIAFGIGGDGAIRNVGWKELRPAPASVRRFLWNRGIVACRFGEPGHIEYLIDPVDISLPALTVERVQA